MFQLTKRTEYGLIALTHLTTASGRVVSAREIAERYPVPSRLLAEVLKALCRANLVESHRGAHGGYTLAAPAENITVGDVVRTLEGGPLLAECESWKDGLHLEAHLGSCEIESVCPIRSPIHRLHQNIWELLDRTSLRNVAGPQNAAIPAPSNTV